MNELMTRQFAKWAVKQALLKRILVSISSRRDAVLKERGKAAADAPSSAINKTSWRSLFTDLPRMKKIICLQKELHAFKELAKIPLSLPKDSIAAAIESGDFIEVKP